MMSILGFVDGSVRDSEGDLLGVMGSFLETFFFGVVGRVGLMSEDWLPAHKKQMPIRG